MKKNVPFTKEIDFKTMISKITTISLEHTLKANESNNISGYFIVDGKYKMTQASQIDEEFSYKIPVDIEIDSKYDISNITIDIEDFTYELLSDDKLKLDIVVCIDNLEEKEEIVEEVNLDNFDREDDSVEDLFLETTEEQDLNIIDDDNSEEESNPLEENNVSSDESDNYKKDIEYLIDNAGCGDDSSKEDLNNNTASVNSLFSSFKDNAETFKTYYVYIVKEEDSLNSILQKYNIDKELLEEYNDLSNIMAGSKIIIPSGRDE